MQFLARRHGGARAGIAVLKPAATTRRASATAIASGCGESADENAEGETDTVRLVPD